MTGTLMAFVPVSTRVGMTDNLSVAPLVSHAYDAVFTMYSSQTSNGGVRRWDTWPNGNELAVANLADCNAPSQGFIVPWCLTYNRNAIALADSLGDGITLLTQRNFTN